MKCPDCGHVTDAALLKCTSCGEAYNRESLETLEHLKYLIAWLDERITSLGPEAHARLHSDASNQIADLREVLGLVKSPVVDTAEPIRVFPEIAEVTRPTAELVSELNLAKAVLSLIQAWIEIDVINLECGIDLHNYLTENINALSEKLGVSTEAYEPPSDLEVLDYALDNLSGWSNVLNFDPSDLKSLRNHLVELRTEQIPAVVEELAIVEEPELAIPTPAVERPRPPKPVRPKVDWAKWWERAWGLVVSGALLRGLLYLGAFMIVISAAVLVVRFWNIFPTGIQLIFIAAVPSTFYLAGWIVRTKLKLPQAGGVLTGIGALLVAVDFVAVYQFGGLAGVVDLTLYWLIASLACTAIYALSAWRLPTEFFGYISLIGAYNSLLALANTLNLPIEWQIALITASAAATVEISARLDRVSAQWKDLVLSGRRFAQFLLFACILAVIFVPGDAALGQALTFVFATIGYGLLAWRFPHILFAHITVWSSIGAFIFIFRLATLPSEWYGAALGILAIYYAMVDQWIVRRLPDATTLRQDFTRAMKPAYWALVAVSISLGLAIIVVDRWAGVLALTVASLNFGLSAYRDRRPIHVLLGAGLFVVPYSATIRQLLVDFEILQFGAWLITSLVGLALVYLLIAAALRKAEDYVSWLNLIVHILAPSLSFGLVVNYAVTIDTWYNGPTLIALFGILLVYVLSAILHDSGRHPAISRHLTWLPDRIEQNLLLWPVGFLIPVWITIAWMGSSLEVSWLGAAIAGLGVVYVVLGEALRRRKQAYRMPPHSYTYPLVVIGIIVAFRERWPLLTSLYLTVTTFTALAIVYRSTLEGSIAAGLFIWPFQLSLELSPLTTHAYSLAYAILASAGYIPLGYVLDRVNRKYALPKYILGYGIAAYAVVTSLLGRFGWYAIDVPWIGVATPLIISGLLAYGAYHFKLSPFAWITALIFAIAYGQTITLFKIHPQHLGTAWVSLAFVYMLVERVFGARSRTKAATWHQTFHSPLIVGTTILCGLGLFLTSSDTLSLLSGLRVANPYPPILAQILAVGLTALAARFYRNRWPLYIAAVLSFFPYTLIWIALGPTLQTAQFSLVWLGLAAVLLFLGFSLDKEKVRYAHGPYLVGYILSGFALVWSVPDRLVNLYTLASIIGLTTISHIAVHVGRHQSFDDFIRFIWRKSGTIAQRAARTMFLFITVIGIPIWLIQLLTHFEIPLAWRGLSLALTAPIYVAIGLGIRRVKPEYTWPFYGVGYALTAIGAMIAFEDQLLAIAVLVLNTVVYAASAYIFRQAYWLYLSNTLIPIVVLLALDYNQLLISPWVAGVFMGLAFVYFVCGRFFDRRTPDAKVVISPYAVPFYVPGYLLSAIALATASSEQYLAVSIYLSAVVLYLISAWTFRESIFLYPAAWLAAVPYYLGMRMIELPMEWYGLGWLPLIFFYIGIGKFIFQYRKPALGITSLRTFLKSLTHPAMPFYLLAYALSVSMVILSTQDTLTLTLALTAASAIYFASAALFRRHVWLYPGLLAAHLALAAVFDFRPPGIDSTYITLPFLLLTWIVALIGGGFTQRFPVTHMTDTGKRVFRIMRREVEFGNWPVVGYLITPSWAQPFFLFAAVDIILWQWVSQFNLEIAMIVAIGNALLLGIFATSWRDTILAHGTLALFVLGVINRFDLIGVSLAFTLAWLSGIGFGLYILARIAELIIEGTQGRLAAFNVWLSPFANFAVALTTLAVIGTLPTIQRYGIPAIASLTFAGALYLAIAYRGRYIRLSYLGMALLELAWVLVLFDRGIRQPQWYAIPAGLYFTIVGYLERHRGRRLFATLVESFGLTVLLITSFIQSISGIEGFPYFVLLLVEGLIVIWWGASQRRKVPFFIGLGSSTINVVSQVIVLINVYQVERWILILGVGLLLVSAAVFVERKREQIIAQAQVWLEDLEKWE
jgi:hypothetical protein